MLRDVNRLLLISVGTRTERMELPFFELICISSNTASRNEAPHKLYRLTKVSLAVDFNVCLTLYLFSGAYGGLGVFSRFLAYPSSVSEREAIHAHGREWP